MNIDTLGVLDQLPFHSSGVIQFDDARGNGKQFRKLRDTETWRPCDEFEAIRLGMHGDGLNYAMLPDGFGKLIKFGFLEGLAGIGGGFVNLVDGEVLERAAVLHDCTP